MLSKERLLTGRGCKVRENEEASPGIFLVDSKGCITWNFWNRPLLRQLKLNPSPLHHQPTCFQLCSVMELNICATQPFSQHLQPDCLAHTFLGFCMSLCPVENHGGGTHSFLSNRASLGNMSCIFGAIVWEVRVFYPHRQLFRTDKCYIRQECWQCGERDLENDGQ